MVLVFSAPVEEIHVASQLNTTLGLCLMVVSLSIVNVIK